MAAITKLLPIWEFTFILTPTTTVLGTCLLHHRRLHPSYRGIAHVNPPLSLIAIDKQLDNHALDQGRRVYQYLSAAPKDHYKNVLLE